MEVYNIKDKVFFITGAASGIGALTVKRFLEEGAKHVAFLDIAEEVGKTFESELKESYGETRVKFYKCDVTREDQLTAAYDDVIKQHNYIDCVVNNAGIMNDSPALYKKEIEINVTALITSTLKAYHFMNKENGGRGGTVINIASNAALYNYCALPIYFATKSAVLQFSNCLGMEPTYSRTGVRVVCVCFGATDTTLFSPQKLDFIDQGMEDIVDKVLPDSYFQRPESAVNCVIEAFKHGRSASTWIAYNDKKPLDITGDVTEAYNVLSSYINKTMYYS